MESLDGKIIQATKLTKEYTEYSTKVLALRGINLDAESGEYIGILGPSGSGKSTLLHVLGCIDRPTEGDLVIDGINTRGLSDSRLSFLRGDRFGFIFQEKNLLPTMTVLNNVMLPGIIRMGYQRVDYASIEQRARDLISRVDLDHRIEHKAMHLSGGEQQRVAIARALMNEPDVIFADEPTGALDSTSASSIMDIFKKLNESGITIVIVTHDESLVRDASRRIKMIDGEIVDDRRV